MHITEHEKEDWLETYPGSDGGQKKKVEILKLYEQTHFSMISRAYKSLNMNDSEEDEDKTIAD